MRLRFAAFAFSLTLLSVLGEAPTPQPTVAPAAPPAPPLVDVVFVAPLLPNAPFVPPEGLARAQVREREAAYAVEIAQTATNEA